jgi:hypothetical protein
VELLRFASSAGLFSLIKKNRMRVANRCPEPAMKKMGVHVS